MTYNKDTVKDMEVIKMVKFIVAKSEYAKVVFEVDEATKKTRPCVSRQ